MKSKQEKEKKEMVNIIHTESGEIMLTVTLAEFEEFGITVPGHHAEVVK
jgi:hypothetical protein